MTTVTYEVCGGEMDGMEVSLPKSTPERTHVFLAKRRDPLTLINPSPLPFIEEKTYVKLEFYVTDRVKENGSKIIIPKR